MIPWKWKLNNSQFHQHFMSSFCTKSYQQEITSPNCKHIKGVQKHLYKKSAGKMFVKLTPAKTRNSLSFTNSSNRKWNNFIELKVSISPTIYKELFLYESGFTSFMCLQVVVIIFFGKRKLVQKLLVRCWWNYCKDKL